MRNQIKIYLRGIPLCYLAVFKLKSLYKAPEYNLCSKECGLCIEAYPSSASSFLFHLIKELNNSLEIAHHTHSITNIKLAIKYNVPSFIIVRDPADAISSRVVRFNVSMDYSVAEYIWFYSFVLGHIKQLSCFDFHKVTDQTQQVLSTIENISGVNLNLSAFETAEKAARSEIMNSSKQKNKLDRKPLPSKQREIQKQQVKTTLKNHKEFQLCQKLYLQLSPLKRSAK